MQKPEPNRYAACVEYRGTAYHGWQKQSHADSVQERLERAVSRVADEPVSVTASGRTDSGVHAIGQIVHFDAGCVRSQDEWLRGINTYLPKDISVHWVVPVDRTFHARFGSRGRSYRYVILNSRSRPALLDGLVTWHRPRLDIVSMQRAAARLTGRHDFSAFRAAECQNRNPVKHVTALDLDRHDAWIWLDISADGFLHHMVRNVMGVLTRIGEGREQPEWARHVLDSRDRTQGGVTAPPDGLYFVSSRYAPGFDLPLPPAICRFW